ncbi:MAG TPA: hypothetical protein DCS63_05990 [Elusimicrobia bacterium]|nr:hypothetical protein [Elusimicrobiota bacterium]
MNRKHVLFFSILAAAFFCRVYFAVNFPVTLDEAWSNMVGLMPMEGLVKEVKADIHPPLTYIAHKFFTASQTELGIRWIFALFSFLSIFYLTRFINANVTTLLLLGFSAYLISEGAIARMHAFSLFFSSAACYYFARTFEREKAADFALLALFSVLALYNFYPCGALVAAFFAVYLLFRKESVSRPRFYAYTFSSIILFSLPLVYFFNPSVTGGFASEKLINIPSGAILAYLPYAFAYSEYLLKFNEIRGIKIVYFLFLCALVVPVLVRGARNKDGDLRARLAVWLALISLGIVFAVSLKIPKVLLSSKYVAWEYPLFAYIFIKGLESFPVKIRGFLLSALLAVNFASLYSALKYNPENWREVAAFVGRNEKEKDLILFDAGHMRYPFKFYYTGKGKMEGLPKGAPEFKPQEYMRYNRIWLVLAHNWGRSEVYRELISKSSALAGDYAFGEIKVLLFEQNGYKNSQAARH